MGHDMQGMEKKMEVTGFMNYLQWRERAIAMVPILNHKTKHKCTPHTISSPQFTFSLHLFFFWLLFCNSAEETVLSSF